LTCAARTMMMAGRHLLFPPLALPTKDHST
jgi:hypothetical protein